MLQSKDSRVGVTMLTSIFALSKVFEEVLHRLRLCEKESDIREVLRKTKQSQTEV